MIIFIDTSAWIKYFIEEDGTREIQEFMIVESSIETNQFSASAVTYAEVHATLKRALKGKRITQDQFDQAISVFRDQWENVDIPIVDNTLIVKSGKLANEYALKGCDAFQLASALIVHASIFINSDVELHEAAKKCGLQVWNTATHHSKFK
ncbi:type II toxin-antitoxin system VapC family toxin [candidate division KSB1 bacterium]|nr:type II toxin-antitoxin system VapC family toxin [candidate division KSB1 bacterium]MBL7095496.1 type II toxin-antitoxin system VapC family toxin [candidate division KSB1 bacterium]